MTASQTPTTAEELRGAGLTVTAARVALLGHDTDYRRSLGW